MIILDFENLLYKHISEIADAELLYDESIPYTKEYTIKGNYYFIGESYQTLFISTDKNDTLQNFSFAVNRIMDKSFYNEMIKRLGKPSSMYRSDKITNQGVKKIGGTEANPEVISRSTIALLKECTFEENPSTIIWDKGKYKIKVIIKYGVNLFNPTMIRIGNIDFINDKLKKEIKP